MKPNHLLTRLRQDLRKMASAGDEERYLKYRKYATGKLKRLRDQYRNQELRYEDVRAFHDAINVFADIIGVHDSS